MPLLRQVKTNIIFLINFFFTLLCLFGYFFIKVLSPIILIRFGALRNEIIGNSFFDLEYYLSYKKKYNKKKTIDFFFPATNTYVNTFFEKIARLPVAPRSTWSENRQHPS